MNDKPFIPPRTAQKLQESHPEGTRHKAAMEIAIPLLGNGLSPQAVFQTLRDKFAADVTDDELKHIVEWAAAKNPGPSGGAPIQPQKFYFRPQIQTPTQKKRSPLEYADWWVSGARTSVAEFKALSRLPIPEKRSDALCLALEMLYRGDENLNIVCAFTEEGGKAKPHGPGRIVSRDKWIEYVHSKGVPESKAGAWIRPNPCKPQGSGAAGAVTDSDIVAWKFLLLESDILPLEVQLALFARLRLPIAMAVLSGGISAHALVKIDAQSAEKFSEIARRILVALEPFGIDQCNKNPSRLSRLPEARRIIGASETGYQSLLWLNPTVAAVSKADLAAFEYSLEMPAIEEKPFRKVVLESLDRYDLLRANRGKTGVPTGFQEFDADTGGLQAGWMSVLAGETNTGKSTVALNIINNALAAQHGVALFTLEMGRDEIADLLFSMNCQINRNHFNTGDFNDSDIQKLKDKLKAISLLPLWVFDESVMTVSQIRKRILALKAEGKIDFAVVDYAQIVMPEGGDNREQEVAHIARTLCATAKEAKISLLVLSQLNDEGKVRESRVIAHEAHNVFVLKNEEEQHRIIFKVVKGRRIRKKDYTLIYQPAFCTLVNTILEKSDIPDNEPIRKTYPD